LPDAAQAWRWASPVVISARGIELNPQSEMLMSDKSVVFFPSFSAGMAALLAAHLFFASAEQAAADESPKAAAGPTVENAIAAEQESARALRENDADAVARILADDWDVVSTDGGWGKGIKKYFVDQIRSGQFTRKTMEISDIKVRLNGNVAIVTEHVSTSGTFGVKPQSFDVKEVQTDVLIWSDGGWKSIVTHETKVPAHE
jgi:ketosteroid isomerase-like protein